MRLSRSRFPKSDCILQLRGSSSVQPSKSPKPFSSHQLRYYCCSISSAQCWIVSSSAQCWIISSAQCWIICHQPKAGLFRCDAPSLASTNSSSYEWLTTATNQLASAAFLLGFPSLSLSATRYIISLQFSKVFMNGSPQPCISSSPSAGVLFIFQSWFLLLWFQLACYSLSLLCSGFVPLSFVRTQVHFMGPTVRRYAPRTLNLFWWRLLGFLYFFVQYQLSHTVCFSTLLFWNVIGSPRHRCTVIFQLRL